MASPIEHDRRSPIDSLRGRSKKEILAVLDELSDEEILAIEYDWRDTWARPEQLPPDGPWFIWLIEAGRGFGKTRTGAETVIEYARSAGEDGRIALVGRTAADVRKVMIEGESGILACSPPDFRPIYEPSKRMLTWPNGCIAETYSADKPDQLRGPQHGFAWCDELAAYPNINEVVSNLTFGLRLGRTPRMVVTTTPKPKQQYRKFKKRANLVVTSGSTYANRANLPKPFLDELLEQYEGTHIGEQELWAKMLDEDPRALWTLSLIEAHRVNGWPELSKIVVAIDPATTATEDSDETGMIVFGVSTGFKPKGYVLEDLSGRWKPEEWGARAVEAFHRWHADAIVPEVNNGGDLVISNIAQVDENVPVDPVWASRGKRVRAEPVSTLYEKGRIWHVGGYEELEDQMTNWVPGLEDSPDRLDALVYAATATMIGPVPKDIVVETGHEVGRTFNV